MVKLEILWYLVLSWALVQRNVESYSSNGGRIISGRDANAGEFPYQVEIFREINDGDDLFPVCGGSIIDERHVLTAGHCIFAQIISKLVIVAGVTNISLTTDPHRISVHAEQAYMHEDYDDKYLYNDIAVVRVEERFPLSNAFVQAIPLREQALPGPAACIVTGWGNMRMFPFPSEYPQILQALEVPLIEDTICKELYEEYDVIPGMMCAGYVEGMKDSCDGDSGGPLVCGGQLTGVVSWGEMCAQPNSPGVYSEVAYYNDWIAKTLTRSNVDTQLLQRSLP